MKQRRISGDTKIELKKQQLVKQLKLNQRVLNNDVNTCGSKSNITEFYFPLHFQLEFVPRF